MLSREKCKKGGQPKEGVVPVRECCHHFVLFLFFFNPRDFFYYSFILSSFYHAMNQYKWTWVQNKKGQQLTKGPAISGLRGSSIILRSERNATDGIHWLGRKEITRLALGFLDKVQFLYWKDRHGYCCLFQHSSKALWHSSDQCSAMIGPYVLL